jgi:predicted NBD/HSP70 family sugar kinase
LDIGDSVIRGGLYVDGMAREVCRRATPRASRGCGGEEVLLRSVREMIAEIVAVDPRVAALAVSASGIMTLRDEPGTRSYGPFADRELFVTAPNIDGLKQTPLVTRLESLGFDLPVHVENDCNAATRSAPDLVDAICVNLGAGLGAAVMRNHRIEHVKGSWSCHEVGHGSRWSLPEAVTRTCHCGSYGCLEAAIGGWAMTERYRTRPEDALPEVYEQMREDVVELLPLAIADVVRLSGVDAVVVSGKGGVGYSQGSDFLERLRERTEKLLGGTSIRIGLSDLGEQAELQGVSLALLDCGVLDNNDPDNNGLDDPVTANSAS